MPDRNPKENAKKLAFTVFSVFETHSLARKKHLFETSRQENQGHELVNLVGFNKQSLLTTVNADILAFPFGFLSCKQICR